MTAFLAEYGLFLLKTLSLGLMILLLFLAFVGLVFRQRQSSGEGKGAHLQVEDVSERFFETETALRREHGDKKAFKHWLKSARKQREERKKHPEKTVYLLDFKGNIQATAVAGLREEITAILSVANPGDEVVLRLESAGGVVHGYGLAASQLQRLRDQNIPLTICVDKVAASGGYMMACLADKLIAAPFAILGSIGVVAQLPNINRLLKKHDIDVELHTAGVYKRTLTVIGENTDEARDKFREDLEQTHQLFKQFVRQARPVLDVDAVSTGEIWFGTDALSLQLIDCLGTSDDYLLQLVRKGYPIYRLRHCKPQTLLERLGKTGESSADRLLLRWWNRLQQQLPHQ